MSQIISPRAIFSQANAFEMAAVKLSNIAGIEAGSTAIPRIVNLVFSLELYLKCLILLETNKSERGHNLKVLFSLVSTTAQQNIKNTYQDFLDKNPHIEREAKEFAALLQKHAAQFAIPSSFTYTGVDFDTIIDESKDAFQQFRYIFDPTLNKNKVSFSTLQSIASAIKKAIWDLEPTWDVSQNSTISNTVAVISATEEFKQVIARKPPTIELAYTLAPNIKKAFPAHRDGRVVVLWPKTDLFVCPGCKTITNIAPLREYIETYSGRQIQQTI
jgi:hypothetical protein